jgi:beta-galactosidase
VSEDVVQIDKGTLPALDLAPGATTEVHVPFKTIAPKPGREYFLQLSFVLAKPELWAKTGYEVATEQFKLPFENPAEALTAKASGKLSFSEDAKQITVQGERFSVAFDKTQGAISQITRDRIPMLVPGGGPKLHLWRAPHQKDDIWAYDQWVKYGIDNLQTKVLSIDAVQLTPTSVRVQAAVQQIGLNGWSATLKAVYTVNGDGSIQVKNAFVAEGTRIQLARIGVRMMLDKRYDRFTYLGRGPMENYSDRDRGSDIGLFTSTVREQLTPYSKPMEAGNHEDIRWAALGGNGLPGLLAVSDGKPMQASALPYTDEQLASVEYSVNLPPSNATVLMLAARTLGVGSNSCGPRPLEKYAVWSDPTEFSYLLRILPAGQKDYTAEAHVAAANTAKTPHP